jgi:hypothetical protein
MSKDVFVQELGKAMGMQTIVFNCGDALDHAFMAGFLSGVAQCGAFCCFDEFNRISVEVWFADNLAILQSAFFDILFCCETSLCLITLRL